MTDKIGKDLWPGVEKFLDTAQRFWEFMQSQEGPRRCHFHVGYAEHGEDESVVLSGPEALGAHRVLAQYNRSKSRISGSPALTLYLDED